MAHDLKTGDDATQTQSDTNHNITMASNHPRWSMFLRAIGVKPGFRRTGPSSLFNIALAAGLGVVTSQYIFKQPLEDYWAEQRQLAEEGKGVLAGREEKK